MDKKIIGERLRNLRGSKNKKDVAKSVGVSIRAIDSYELGERIPRDEIKLKLAKYYEVSVDYIFIENKKHESCD